VRISCLTVTHAARLAALERAMRAFAWQTWRERELIVVHDGGADLQASIERLAARFPQCEISIHPEPGGRSLGALRNVSVARARGPIVCQWDDDDLYHCERLERQVRKLIDEGADFCFFTDQMHLFTKTGELYWDDWTVERPPMHLIQGTLLGYRSRMGRYPDVARGEDTPLVLELVSRGARIAELRDAGWLYVYVYDGANAFDQGHHAAISTWKRRRRDALLRSEEWLLPRLREHDWPVPFVFMPFEGGRFVVTGAAL